MGSLRLLPSIDRLVENALSAAKRFSLALSCATASAIISVILIENRNVHAESTLIKLGLVLFLGLPLFIALRLLSERYSWSTRLRVVVHLVAIALLYLYYLSLPLNPFEVNYHGIRLAIVALGLHFLVAVAAFIGASLEHRFWQFNKSLLLNFLISAFYSAALYLGLVIAMAAANLLFGLEIKPDRYGELFVLMAGIINTWIFLALIPLNLPELDSDMSYPTSLKVFSQYVLLPLVGLYFAILIIYEAKVIVQWSWPKGWVSQLVLWYSVVGILALLLLHPLKNREGSKWIGRFSDWFFRLLVPLVIMLFLAIRRRIHDYGVTEPRYAVLILSVGLAIVVLYFIFSRRKDIRAIPFVLVFLCVISAYGPLSASSVSLWSQSSRLEEMLLANGIWKDGALVKPATPISVEKRRDMSSVIAYLTEAHGLHVFAKWIPDSLVRNIEKITLRGRGEFSSFVPQVGGAATNANDSIAHLLGFEFNWSPYFGNEGRWVSLWVEEPNTLNIAGYERLLSFEFPGNRKIDSAQYYVLDGDTLVIRVTPKSSLIEASFKSAGDTSVVTATLDVEPRVVELYRMNNPRQIPQDSLVFDRTAGAYDLRFLLRSVNGERRDSALELSSLHSRILVQKHR